MPTNATESLITVHEDGSAYLMDYITGADGADMTVASLTEIAVKSIEIADPTTIPLDTTLTIASVVFDTLQTTALDARWTKTGGYNFAYEVPVAAFPLGTDYSLEFKFTPGTAEVFWRKYRVTALETLSS